MRNFLLSLMAMLVSFSSAVAQATTTDHVPMADGLRAEGKIYVVVLVMLVIFIAVAVYLFTLDRRVKKLEKDN